MVVLLGGGCEHTGPAEKHGLMHGLMHTIDITSRIELSWAQLVAGVRRLSSGAFWWKDETGRMRERR